MVSIDYFYQIDPEDFNKDQFKQKVDLLLVIGTDVGNVISLEIKFTTSDFSEFSFISLNNMRKKKYFHRIEDVINR